MNLSNKKGFTLIELLVVIAIIGILASVILASLSSARQKARDARRKIDIQQLTTAINAYFAATGDYPNGGGAAQPNTSWANSNDASWTTFQTIMQNYISKLPTDPSQTNNSTIWAGTGYAYSYVNCGRNYMLVYQLEIANGPDPSALCGATTYQYGGSGANTTIKTTGRSY